MSVTSESAIHFDRLIRQGIVRDYASLARLGGVSRARITQIMNLLNLPSWKQEEILFLPGTVRGRDVLTEREMRTAMARSNWHDKSCKSGCDFSKIDHS